jgi:hypothetical protein
MFTPNDNVKVKLTDHGKKLIVDYVDAFNERMKTDMPSATFRLSVPKWGIDGVWEAQFHTVMDYFDGCWKAGCKLPFEWVTKSN